MKIKELNNVVKSTRAYTQFAILHDTNICKDIESGVTIEYIIHNYGELKIKNMIAYENDIIIEV